MNLLQGFAPKQKLDSCLGKHTCFADWIFQKIAASLHNSLDKDFWCLRFGTSTGNGLETISGFDALWGQLYGPSFSLRHHTWLRLLGRLD